MSETPISTERLEETAKTGMAFMDEVSAIASELISFRQQAQPTREDGWREDAERWRALMSSPKMHFMGSAGFEHTLRAGAPEGSRKLEDQIATPRAGETWHFGMEFWFGIPEDARYSDTFERQMLTTYVDAIRALKFDAPAAPHVTKPAETEHVEADVLSAPVREDHIADAGKMVGAEPAAHSLQTEWVSLAARDVLAERERQKSVEGWTPEHDDQHTNGELARAAAAYAVADVHGYQDDGWGPGVLSRLWPWEAEWWKPSDVRRNLVKAGALLIADIERLDRIEAATANSEPERTSSRPFKIDRLSLLT